MHLIISHDTLIKLI